MMADMHIQEKEQKISWRVLTVWKRRNWRSEARRIS